MACTRNKNTLGNYSLEQRQLSAIRENIVYPNAANGEAWSSRLAGDGFLPSRLPKTVLSRNPEDTESFLFGIGSTNLVNPQFAPFVPEIVVPEEAVLYQRNRTVYLPTPLTVDPFARPLLYRQ
jgi:hypothetical protein